MFGHDPDRHALAQVNAAVLVLREVKDHAAHALAADLLQKALIDLGADPAAEGEGRAATGWPAHAKEG